MQRRQYKFAAKQQGAILVVSLMFLIAITLFTVSSMRSSNIGLRIAQNEESRVAAVQAAQALADAMISLLDEAARETLARQAATLRYPVSMQRHTEEMLNLFKRFRVKSSQAPANGES